MVEFLTFFLVLSTGTTPIELTVTPPVVRVEVLLDGRDVATLTGAPWSFICDLGADPEPRELIAIGRNPLYIWSTAPGGRSAWGEATFVGALPKRPQRLGRCLRGGSPRPRAPSRATAHRMARRPASSPIHRTQ